MFRFVTVLLLMLCIHFHTRSLPFQIWNVADGNLIDTYRGCNDFISYCVYHPSGKRIMATSQNYLQVPKFELVFATTSVIVSTIQCCHHILCINIPHSSE